MQNTNYLKEIDSEDFENFIKKTLTEQEYKKYIWLKHKKEIKNVASGIKNLLKPVGYEVYSVGQGVVKIAVSIASGGRYKPDSFRISTAYNDAQKKAEICRKNANKICLDFSEYDKMRTNLYLLYLQSKEK